VHRCFPSRPSKSGSGKLHCSSHAPAARISVLQHYILGTQQEINLSKTFGAVLRV
jgi:hypothetical protein